MQVLELEYSHFADSPHTPFTQLFMCNWQITEAYSLRSAHIFGLIAV